MSTQLTVLGDAVALLLHGDVGQAGLQVLHGCCGVPCRLRPHRAAAAAVSPQADQLATAPAAFLHPAANFLLIKNRYCPHPHIVLPYILILPVLVLYVDSTLCGT